MKAKPLPQEGIVLELIENLYEVIWSKIASGGKKFINVFIENLLTDEVAARVGAGRYERSSKRRGYRNGHYLRNLLTRFGLIEDIRLPRLEQGGMEFPVLNRWEPGEDKPRKELLSFQLTEMENNEAWRGFLADLKGRGLLSKSL